MMKKKSDIPQDLQKVNAPVSKEYDAVRYVYNQYRENGINSLPWRDFQKRFQGFAQRYNTLFTEIRRNRPAVTLDDLQEYLVNYKNDSKNYDLSYATYGEEEHSFRGVEQLVLQINQGASAREILDREPVLKRYISMVGQSSEQSGHPANEDTVGWLRADFIDEDWLLVDEAQSDLVNSCAQAKNIVTSRNFEEFLAGLNNEHVKSLVLEKISEQQFIGVRRHFIQSGYTPEKLDEIKQRLVDLFKDWAEYALSTLIEIARRNGIKNIAIHTTDTIARRDPSVEADKIVIYYTTLARSFGFRKQQLNHGDLNGEFWVRKVGKFKAKFLN
jgi:hypothetical protein